MIPCIEALLVHNISCREPLLRTIGLLTDDEFTRDLGAGLGSIRDILIHLMNTEVYWIESVLRNKSETWFQPEEFTDVMNIEHTWKNIASSTIVAFREQNEESMQYVKSIRWGDRTVSFTIAKMFMHLATHETHHRGLLVGLLRQLGHEPPDVNML